MSQSKKSFGSIDPLQQKKDNSSEAATSAIKREVKNILDSYVGWFDPFCELIQNALDSVEEKNIQNDPSYEPSLWITIDIQDNRLTVTDNGLGLDEEKFKKFTSPNFSFKPGKGKTRGHKGVGATYLAYGFNYMQIATKVYDFYAVGKILGARSWLSDENPASNPLLKDDNEEPHDQRIITMDSGVSISIKFDPFTKPKDLKYIMSDNAEKWYNILCVTTGLGAFTKNEKINVQIDVLDKFGNQTVYTKKGIQYFWPHLSGVPKVASYTEIDRKKAELFKKHGEDFSLPTKYKELDIVYDYFDTDRIKHLISEKFITLDEEAIQLLDQYKPVAYFGYAYSVRVWESINEKLGVRTNTKILYGGIQISADNMPQGTTIQIPLKRNIGRQNQVHVNIHFNNCSADMGRKNFSIEVLELAKDLAKEIIDGPLQKIRKQLKPNTGTIPELQRLKEVSDWKNEMQTYEKDFPLKINSDIFFLPTKQISITSEPKREQDVIALFNQLLAGGVIRSIRVMSTNERLTYDGLYKVVIETPNEHHLFDASKNPLGVLEATLKGLQLPFEIGPMVLEYKVSLDGLIEDIQSGAKNSNDIDLVIVWDTGSQYTDFYNITSLLDSNNGHLREHHGLTHIATNISSEQKEFRLIVLKELIAFLNDPRGEEQRQQQKYP